MKIKHFLFAAAMTLSVAAVAQPQPPMPRPDDKEDAIVHRLEVYTSQTEPLIEYYRKKGLIKEIDASVKPSEVFERLKATL